MAPMNDLMPWLPDPDGPAPNGDLREPLPQPLPGELEDPQRRPTFLSLFSGIGGLDLALEYHGWRCIGHVENDPYCDTVLAQRWPNVPRWGDITKVDWGGVTAWTGPVDLVAAGFPCQPTSQAGQRKAQKDPRWLWPEVTRCLRHLRPRYVFLENTLGLLSRGFDDVLGGLAALGFDAQWDGLQAADVGAPHERDRVFVLAYANSGRWAEELEFPAWEQGASGHESWLGGEPVANATGFQPERERDARVLAGSAGSGTGEGSQRQRVRDAAGGGGPDVADTDGEHGSTGELERSAVGRVQLDGNARPGDRAGQMADPAGTGRGRSSGAGEPGGRRPGSARRLQPRRLGEGDRGQERESEPRLGGDADGPAAGLDGHRWPAPPGPDQYPWEPPRTVGRGVPFRGRRVKALGNAVVPAQGALAFAVLWDRMEHASTPATQGGNP